MSAGPGRPKEILDPVRVTSYIPREHSEYLWEEANRRRITLSLLLREVIADRYMVPRASEEPLPPHDPPVQFR